MRRTLQNLLFGILSLSPLIGHGLPARAQAFDGTWTGRDYCPASGNMERWSESRTATIVQNHVRFERNSATIYELVEGTVGTEGTVSVAGQGQRRDRPLTWNTQFSGRASATAVRLTGTRWRGRPCVIELSNTRPAPYSLAGLEIARQKQIAESDGEKRAGVARQRDAEAARQAGNAKVPSERSTKAQASEAEIKQLRSDAEAARQRVAEFERELADLKAAQEKQKTVANAAEKNLVRGQTEDQRTAQVQLQLQHLRAEADAARKSAAVADEQLARFRAAQPAERVVKQQQVQFADQAPDEWAGEERLIEAELQQLRSEADTARQKAREVKTQLVGLRAAQTRDHAAGQATDHAVKELAHRQQTAEGDLQRLQSQADAADAKAAELATQLAALHAVQEKDRNAALAQNRATRQRVEDFLKEAKFEVFLEKRDDWILRKAAIPIQQQQFCHIIEQFEPELRRIEKVSNEIRRNLLFLDRRKDLETLLPQGRFGNWVLHVKEVTQAKDGSAAIVLQGPCPVMFGSDTCERNGSKISATVQKNTPMFRELTKLGNDDYVVASGTILFLTHEDQVQELPEEAVYRPGEYCSDNAGTKIQDVFVTDLNYLVQLR